MLVTDIKRNEGNNIGHGGLALIGEMAKVCGIDTLVDSQALDNRRES